MATIHQTQAMCAKMQQSLKLRAMGISTLSAKNAANFPKMPKDHNCPYQQQQKPFHVY